MGGGECTSNYRLYVNVCECRRIEKHIYIYISDRSSIGLYCPYGEHVTVGGLCGDSQMVCDTYYHVVDRETIGISMLPYDQ